ncbi:MAG: hypothetical protein KKD66_12560 [Proteobacteria bacterium]|nr:hypothetical protein [Pseudomonadota bacterium]
MTNKPEVLTEDHLIYLDDLRESGITNMYGARSYLLNEFPELSNKEASSILVYWMKIFSERFNFKISMISNRCQRIPENKDTCPGTIQDCGKLSGPACDGMTIVTCFFPFH